MFDDRVIIFVVQINEIFQNFLIVNTVLHIFTYYFIPEGIVNKFQDFLIRREIWRLELTAETVRVGRSVRRQKLNWIEL